MELTIKNKQQDSKSVSYKTKQTKYNLSAVNTYMHLNLEITWNNELHPGIIRVWSYIDLRFLLLTFQS